MTEEEGSEDLEVGVANNNSFRSRQLCFFFFTFPRGAAWGGDLARCVAGRGKYGLPAFPSVLSSPGAAGRQRGQACVPKTRRWQKQMEAVKHVGQRITRAVTRS